MESYSFPIKVINACWIIFAVVWLLTAATTKPAVYRESRVGRLRYWVLLVIGYLLLVNGRRLPYPLNLRVIPHTLAIAWTGALVCAVGLAFALLARATIGRNWSGTITLKANHELILRGPYRLVRHPIYTGLLTMFIATGMVMGHLSGIIAVLPVFVSFWIKLRDEEKLMLKQFPHEYASYQERVKRIIPFVL